MTSRFLELLRALDRHSVEHVGGGGVAAILEGAPMTTLDRDVVFRVDDDNVSRLHALLVELDAQYRDPAGRRIRLRSSSRSNRDGRRDAHHQYLTLQDADAVAAALQHFRRRPKVGFSDCLILEVARKAGHTPLGTFDRRLGKLDGAQRL